MESPIDVAPDFLARLAALGSGTWSKEAPVRLMSVAFAPGRVTAKPLTGYLHREEAEALQLSIVAMSRVLEREAGNVIGAGSHILSENDSRTFGTSQFLVVESDKSLRPIRATDAWGYFRNNLGQQMTIEFLGSRQVPGGVFSDTSPQRVDPTLESAQILLDPAMLPVATSKQFKDLLRDSGDITQTFLAQNFVNFHHQAIRRDGDLEQLTKTLMREQQIDQTRAQGPGFGL